MSNNEQNFTPPPVRHATKEETAPVPSINSIVRMAIEKSVSVEVLEKLLALQERFDANQAKKSYDAAITAARPELPAIKKTLRVDFKDTHYAYEDLSDMVNSFTPVLARHGLNFKWRTTNPDVKTIKVTCVLSHEQGHSEENDLCCGQDLTGNKNQIQGIGSAVKYLQRYTLKAALGVAAMESDDDGRASSNLESKKRAPAAPPTKAPDDRPTRVVLWERILAYCNDDRKSAGEILRRVTGKPKLAGTSDLTEAEALTGMEFFKRDYLDKIPTGDDALFNQPEKEREPGQER